MVFRTALCGHIAERDVGTPVVLSGWVDTVRDHGGVVFLDLRDRYGVVQVVCEADDGGPHRVAARLRRESVIRIQGHVAARPVGQANPSRATGAVEVRLQRIDVLNECATVPFPIHARGVVDEAVRLRHRYLDLRRERLQRNVLLRHQIVQLCRDHMNLHGFLEVATPTLVRSTPEGAREFLVPSRVHPGRFYALAQSAQQHKQLLMVAGIDRYYQFARCYRDEAMRADRQLEFTQLDVEMSFVDTEDVLSFAEGLFTFLTDELPKLGVVPKKRLLARPFPRLGYAEAMRDYGSDKPDLRFEWKIRSLEAHFEDPRVFFDHLVEPDPRGDRLAALRVPGLAARPELLRSIGVPRAEGVSLRALSPATARGDGGVPSSVREALFAQLEVNGDDVVYIAWGPSREASSALGRLRAEIGPKILHLDPDLIAFAWIVDPPLVEWDHENSRWTAVHHPFTAPLDGDLERFADDPAAIRAKAYDIVANGWEIGGGSIRNHRRDRQEAIFGLVGLSPERMREDFGHMLTALGHGAPPHGGFGPGIERLTMLFAGETNLREVIPFPKTVSGTDPLLAAPSAVPVERLRELHVRVRPAERTRTPAPEHREVAGGVDK